MLLPVQWQAQPTENFCWATVSSMVAIYYASVFGIGQPLSPCQVATATLPEPTCCPQNPAVDPIPGACDVPFDIAFALSAIQHLNTTPPSLSGFDLVVQEITNQRPLCAMIKYSAGPFHYVLVNGCDPASQQVAIVDPAGRPTQLPVPFANFVANSSFTLFQWVLTV